MKTTTLAFLLSPILLLTTQAVAEGGVKSKKLPANVAATLDGAVGGTEGPVFGAAARGHLRLENTQNGAFIDAQATVGNPIVRLQANTELFPQKLLRGDGKTKLNGESGEYQYKLALIPLKADGQLTIPVPGGRRGSHLLLSPTLAFQGDLGIGKLHAAARVRTALSGGFVADRDTNRIILGWRNGLDGTLEYEIGQIPAVNKLLGSSGHTRVQLQGSVDNLNAFGLDHHGSMLAGSLTVAHTNDTTGQQTFAGLTAQTSRFDAVDKDSGAPNTDNGRTKFFGATAGFVF